MGTLVGKLKSMGIDLGNPTHVKKTLIFLAVVLVLIVAAFIHFSGGGGTESAAVVRGEDVTDSSVSADVSAAAVEISEEAPPAAIYVDVAGAVNRPMVVELPGGSRVFEAIEAAGGMTPEADARYLNRAATLNDGDRVYVPTASEVEGGAEIPGAAGVDTAVPGAASTGTSADGKININTADSDTLQQITGVGPATAQKILDYRTQNGKFAAIEDIQNVSGIGAKTFEKMKDQITV
ncbi:MAG: helix-hairpin-helix domain-containing protein [Clostridiales Family XIII bacterium]|nr:helix-hairpin-helix domain-containing protein [Clostridiales Family XIII bacterium]